MMLSTTGALLSLTYPLHCRLQETGSECVTCTVIGKRLKRGECVEVM